MITDRQSLLHAIKHFFTVFLVVKFVFFFFPIKDFFRGLWWKAWGHDTQTPEFHLSQVSFDHHMANQAIISGMVRTLYKGVYGEAASLDSSLAARQLNRFLQLKYLPLKQHDAIKAFFTTEYPGPLVEDWFCKTDGISPRTLELKLQLDPHFAIVHEYSLQCKIRIQ